MGTALVRSTLLRTALRGGGRGSGVPRRNFSSSAHHNNACWSHSFLLSFLPNTHDETAKWEKITYLGIATCTVLAIYNLSKGHPHHEEPPAYPHLHICNKEFPWGIS